MGINKDPYLVTGIIEDCPSNSQIKYQCLASFSSLGETQEESYWGANYITYLLLKNRTDIPKSPAGEDPCFYEKRNAAYRVIISSLSTLNHLHVYISTHLMQDLAEQQYHLHLYCYGSCITHFDDCLFYLYQFKYCPLY